MRIGITGASGMLGTALIDKLHFKHEIYATSRSLGIQRSQVHWSCFDLLRQDKLENWLIETDPDIVIHCAAIVNVDLCEKMIEDSKRLHYGVIKKMLILLDSKKKKLIYISTDSLFDGNKKNSYTESDTPYPLNTYSKTKLEGEKLVLESNNGLVLRTSIIGWSRGKKISFSEWLIKGLLETNPLYLFQDVIFSPIHVSDFSSTVSMLIEKKASGLFNLASTLPLSKYEFGLLVSDIFGFPTKNIIKSSISDVNLIANRPKNMGLSCNKLENFLTIKMPLPAQGIMKLKEQYDNGWLSSIKGKQLKSNYHFWE
jgi:dTDP-4-dehydrorhamnose reductase